MSRRVQSLFAIAILVLGFAAGALWMSVRSGTSESDAQPVSLQGEVFLQLSSGDVAHASGCEALVMNPISARGRRWADFLFEASQKKLQNSLTEKKFVEVLRAGMFMVFNQAPPEKLGILDSRPAFADTKEKLGCDSRGNFNINLKPGSYLIVVSGRAGRNEAVWQQMIEVPKDQKISLSRPLASYFDP